MPPCFQDLGSDGDAPPAAAAVPGGAHLLGFSDEILLHILSHIPSTDLVLHVRRTCRKLAELCLDKSLTHTVLLQKDYEVRRGALGWPRVWAGDGGQPDAWLHAGASRSHRQRSRRPGPDWDVLQGASCHKSWRPKSAGSVPPGGGRKYRGHCSGRAWAQRETTVG